LPGYGRLALCDDDDLNHLAGLGGSIQGTAASEAPFPHRHA